MGLQAGGRGFEPRTLHKSLQIGMLIAVVDVAAVQLHVRDRR